VSACPQQVRLTSNLYQEFARVEPQARQLVLEIPLHVVSEQSVITLPFDTHRVFSSLQ
jgi:hypothetical protein